MRKLQLLLVVAFTLAAQVVFAQLKVTGVVKDAAGKPVSGATVSAKGGGTVVTNELGVYTVNVPSAKSTLTITSVGYKLTSINVNGATAGEVSLEADTQALNEVVVTAFGIKREKKALGYAVSTLKKEDLETRPEGDLARVLSGKAPGVNIINTSGLSGSGTNIQIRGLNSITGNSSPLFVVDGVPFGSDTRSFGSFTVGNQNTSRFFDIDPNNIESVNVLKGLSATTLYGEQGANGVILITTKNGAGKKAKSKSEVTVTQSLFQNTVANLPDYNTSYGGGFDLSVGLTFFSNWGAKFTDPPIKVAHPYGRANLNTAFPEFVGKTYDFKYYNSVERFFRKGLVNNTSVSAQGGNENASYNLTYSYLDDKGFVEGNRALRNTLGFGGTTKLANKLRLNTTLNFVLNTVKSPPTSTSFGSRATNTSVFGDVLYTPTAVDLMGLPWENPLDKSHVYYRGGNDIQNPRWTLYNAFTENKTNRFYGQTSLSYDVTKDLNFMYRVGVDNYTEDGMYAQNKGGYTFPTGIYRNSTGVNTIWDHSALVSYKHNFGSDISLNVDGGVNSREIKYRQTGVLSTDQLVYGLLNHGNFVNHDVFSEGGERLDFKENEQTIAAFAQSVIGYKEYAFLTLAGRNSWTSTLEQANRSIFYPSASLSFVPTAAIEGLKGNKYINYIKTRIGYSTGATFPDPYRTRAILNVGTRSFVDRSGTAINSNTIPRLLANPDLKPELAKEVEAGVEGKFIDQRLSVDFTYYRRVLSDQILSRPLDPSTGYTSQTINAGNITNKGIELAAGYTFIRNKNWTWKFDGIFSRNRSEVSNLPADLSEINYAGYTTLGNFAINGQPLGVIKGYRVSRDPKSGQRIVQANGDYQVDNKISVIGDPNPEFRMSGITEVGYKFLTLRVQFEYIKGGAFYSATSSVLLGRGVTKDTEFDRSQSVILPGVKADGTPNDIQISATQAYFNNTVAGGGGGDEAGVYDGTRYRLREASLVFQLPASALRRTPFGQASFSITGSNLWYLAPAFPKYVNFDPETSGLGVGNGQGLEFFTGPSSKRFGATLRLTF
jgi:TonB-linked SusC/RagA family outer membrane protein